MLKSLTLTGDDINVWIQHLPTIVASRLLSVEIRGTDSKAPQLSHASVLCLQRLVQANPQVGLKFDNIQLQDQSDWFLIAESLDLSSLKADDMPESWASHLMSTVYAVDLFV